MLDKLVTVMIYNQANRKYANILFILSFAAIILFLFNGFQDLLKHTPVNHADHAPLSEALAMTRNFLDEFNIIQTKSMFPV